MPKDSGIQHPWQLQFRSVPSYLAIFAPPSSSSSLQEKCVGIEGNDCAHLRIASKITGYDDERGDYNVVDHDQLAYRYEVLGILGKGSFGQVVKCSDHKYKVLRAVKMIRNKRRFHQQALVEVKILEYLRDKVSNSNNLSNNLQLHHLAGPLGHSKGS